MNYKGNWIVLEKMMGKKIVITVSKDSILIYDENGKSLAFHEKYCNFQQTLKKINLSIWYDTFNSIYQNIVRGTMQAYITVGNVKNERSLNYSMTKVKLIPYNMYVENASFGKIMVDIDTFKTICMTFGLLYIPFLFQGTLNQCFDFCNKNKDETSFIPKKTLLSIGDKSFIHDFIIKPKEESVNLELIEYKNSEIKEKKEEVKSFQTSIKQLCNQKTWNEVVHEYGQYDKKDKIKLTNRMIKYISKEIKELFEQLDVETINTVTRKQVKLFIQNYFDKLF